MSGVGKQYLLRAILTSKNCLRRKETEKILYGTGPAHDRSFKSTVSNNGTGIHERYYDVQVSKLLNKMATFFQRKMFFGSAHG